MSLDRFTPLGLVGALLLLTAAPAPSQTPAPPALSLEQGFEHPPVETKPWVYWYWMSDHISKEGITRDLEAMARAGIGEACIGNVDATPKNRGTVKALSEEWWGLVEHAIREGGRTGVKIALFNSPGWSQSGGPWVTPEKSMRYIVSSETRVHGPAKFNGVLPAPNAQFQDVATLAFRAPRLDTDNITAVSPHITSTPATDDVARLFDGKDDTACPFPANADPKQPFTVDLETTAPFSARSLTLHPGKLAIQVNCELQAAGPDGSFQSIRKFSLSHPKLGVNVGPMVYGPVAVSFPPVSSRHFRLIFTGLKETPVPDVKDAGGLAEIELSGKPRLDRYIEKQLGKVFPAPHPMWDAYMWPPQAEPDAPDLSVQPSDIVNLTTRVAADGHLTWDAPPGDWIILRSGMTPTGAKNSPASPEATGLEIDKMSAPYIVDHFNAYTGKLLERMPAADRTALTHCIMDSYEVGPENWTDGFAATFQQRYGYDPLPWLPVMTGRIVGSADKSDRFLWDLRRLVADEIADKYIAGLREISAKHGLKTWLENYGHWGFASEFLKYGSRSSELGGEFWTGGALGDIELRDASSAGHIYSKSPVHAEAFTSGGPAWSWTPWGLKQRGDWAATEGINHFVLHVYIEQPEEKLPGTHAWFGVEFNRHNTWFEQMHDWTDYLRRSHFLLQQGRYVADVLYFIGEDAPKMTGIIDPPLPQGSSFDYINAEVIEKDLQVKDGRFVLANGMSYRLLVLPPQDTMRPELLRKLRDLVNQGGAVLGQAPGRSPSLQNFPASDREVAQLAGELWRDCPDKSPVGKVFGKGRVFRGVGVQAALETLDVPPDLAGLDKKNSPWIHRTTPEGELYFISNQLDQPVNLTPRFRVAGLQPELWDAASRERRDLPNFHVENGATTVPLALAPRQSCFVVFRRPAGKETAGADNFPPFKARGELTGPWAVHFDPKSGGPDQITFDKLEDWTQRPEEGIKYYSGTAVYRKQFDVPAAPQSGGKSRLFLDLGTVNAMARVKLNGKDLGLVWCAPWRVEITDAAKEKDNALEIEVVNPWANRLTGDLDLPIAQRRSPGPNRPKAEKPALLPAGLLGPVTLTAP